MHTVPFLSRCPLQFKFPNYTYPPPAIKHECHLRAAQESVPDAACIRSVVYPAGADATCGVVSRVYRRRSHQSTGQPQTMAHIRQREASPQVRVALCSVVSLLTASVTTSHAAHHLLAIYAMGASADLLNAAYHTHVVYQIPAFPSPDYEELKLVEDARKTTIDESNWKEYLGDERSTNSHVSLPIVPELNVRTGTTKHTSHSSPESFCRDPIISLLCWNTTSSPRTPT